MIALPDPIAGGSTELFRCCLGKAPEERRGPDAVSVRDFDSVAIGMASLSTRLGSSADGRFRPFGAIS